MGEHLGFLRDVQGMVVGGVRNFAQSAETELTGNEERNEKKEQVLETLHTSTHRVMRELGLNRGGNLKT